MKIKGLICNIIDYDSQQKSWYERLGDGRFCENRIIELRKRAETMLFKKVDIREFHARTRKLSDVAYVTREKG